MLIPLSFCVTLRNTGTRILSYIATETTIPNAETVKIEAGGISNPLPIFLFNVVPCFTKNVAVCATHIPNGMVDTQIGIMLIISFVSSTFVTLARFQGLCFPPKLPSLTRIAALSRNFSLLV
ncbi:hypothetical protein V8G54_019626 [Vigna mungo]|uniref:Uncharacterized protein n=1 Tax=Vigna mungo TaxID=3915 RepID=A0AAQ3NC53_VIGMU